VAEPVQYFAPSVEHVGSSLAHSAGVREIAGAAADGSQHGLVERNVLRLCQSPQQGAVFVVKPQIHRHDHIVPKWYYIGMRSRWPARTLIGMCVRCEAVDFREKISASAEARMRVESLVPEQGQCMTCRFPVVPEIERAYRAAHAALEGLASEYELDYAAEADLGDWTEVVDRFPFMAWGTDMAVAMRIGPASTGTRAAVTGAGGA
jgi:hypothetical protein